MFDYISRLQNYEVQFNFSQGRKPVLKIGGEGAGSKIKKSVVMLLDSFFNLVFNLKGYCRIGISRF